MGKRKRQEKLGVYAGSFDPLTVGHMWMIEQGVALFDRLTVTAAVDGSYDAALRALLAHPLVGSFPAAKAILDGYVENLPGLLPTLR